MLYFDDNSISIDTGKLKGEEMTNGEMLCGKEREDSRGRKERQQVQIMTCRKGDTNADKL